MSASLSSTLLLLLLLGPGQVGGGQVSSTLHGCSVATSIQSTCAEAVAAARRRCAAICGPTGFVFSGGYCGVGATCRCGGGSVPGGPGPSPEEP